jgi:hypothetical protein
VTDSGRRAFGIREVNALPDGFSVSLFAPPSDRAAAEDPSRYKVRRYRHVFQGAYHSPPTDEEALHVVAATVAADGRRVRLTLREPLIADRIYEVRTTLADAEPPVAHYTMNKVPVTRRNDHARPR